MVKKEQIDRAISDYGEILAANKNIGMNESLLDADGFPRADIDVYAVRQARHQIICLQNDLKVIMKEIEQGLTNVHAEARANSSTATTTTTKMYAIVNKWFDFWKILYLKFLSTKSIYAFGLVIQNKRANMNISPDAQSPIENVRSSMDGLVHDTPILIVTLVMSGSPAEACGIRLNDEILEFGSINSANFNELKQISELVTHRQNQSIALKVKRNGRIHEITLVPAAWSGRGLLGCNIVIPNPSKWDQQTETDVKTEASPMKWNWKKKNWNEKMSNDKLVLNSPNESCLF